MGDELLTKDDLLNMMESYKSNIEFNKQLINSQEKILDDHGKVIDRLAKITKSQETLGIHLNHLITNLTEHNNSCNASVLSAIESVKNLNRKIEENNVESIKEHSKLKVHLISISGGLILIIIALVTAVGRMWDKIDIIDEVSKYIGM
jgi:cysteinyl-tRNA synthetase